MRHHVLWSLWSILLALVVTSCKQHPNEVNTPDTIQQGIWTNCLELDSAATNGLIMQVGQNNAVSFAVFDFEYGIQTTAMGSMTYDATLRKGSITIPPSCPYAGTFDFTMLDKYVLEFIIESPQRDTIDFIYIASSTAAWWNMGAKDSLLQQYGATYGPMEQYTFSTDIVESWEDLISISQIGVYQNSGVQNGFFDIFGAITGGIGAVTGILGSVSSIMGFCDKTNQEVYDKVQAVAKVCNVMDKKLDNIQSQLTTMADNLNKQLTEIKAQLDRMEQTMEVIKRKQIVEAQLTRLNFTLININQRNSSASKMRIRLSPYRDDLQQLEATPVEGKDSTAYFTDIHHKLAAWDGTQNEAYTDLMLFISTLQEVLSPGGAGMPTVYAQLSVDTKAWEHLAELNQNILLLADMSLVADQVHWMTLYLQSCIRLNIPANNEGNPKSMLSQLDFACKQLGKFYANAKVEIHTNRRVCYINGAHFMTTDTILHYIDYYYMDETSVQPTWCPAKMPWNIDQCVYGFANKDYNVTKNQLLTADEARAIFNYYGADKSLFNMFCDNLIFEYEEDPDRQKHLNSRNIILKGNSYQRNVYHGKFKDPEDVSGLVFFPGACAYNIQDSETKQMKFGIFDDQHKEWGFDYALSVAKLDAENRLEGLIYNQKYSRCYYWFRVDSRY